ANGTDRVTVTYTNTSDSDVLVPLLSLEAENALLRPNGESQFDETQIQFLALSDNGDAGVLAPGESNTFTAEFIPDGTADQEINFSVDSLDSGQVIDWESLRESSRPDDIPPEAWNKVYDNFLAEVGTTVEDYQQLLIENADYLSELGESEPNADNLLAFEFQQASDFGSITQRYSLGSLVAIANLLAIAT
ncbi:MAG: hypothetical protein HC930_13340, partial [Hydrococcus sp. SU_1_0]|nr:hypothetical protein [Hydrococcus sp. SU_1_0]